ncbi:MAG: DUF3820 family protein [Tenuifilaceae bacterium]|nr:DUF3820 family protein [Tenuifilaceae bacterium]
MEDVNPTELNANILKELKTTAMPFGKYKGRKIYTLPEYYLVWYNRKGFPQGKLGILLGTMYEIKLNGLEYLLNKINP